MAKTKKPKKPKAPDLLSQAQAEKEVQYRPQIEMAQGMLGEAAKQYRSDIETAKNNAAAVHAFAEENKAPTIERYAKAQGNIGDYEKNSASALEGTGPASDIFRRAITASQGATRGRVETAGTRASQELSDRQTAALAGRVAATNQARKDYRDTKDTLTSQIKSLVGQQQADVIARFGQLAEQQAANQTKIDVAEIGAQARRDVAAAGAEGKRSTAAAKKAEKERERKGKVREATGTLKQGVANAASLWDQYASRTRPKSNPRFDKDKPISDLNKPYLNRDGNPVENPGNAIMEKMSPQAIRDAIAKEHDIDPGILHIALLRRAKKPLDAEAISYIKANPQWRIPRAWLRNQMDTAIAENRAAGPPRPGV